MASPMGAITCAQERRLRIGVTQAKNANAIAVDRLNENGRVHSSTTVTGEA